MSQSTRAPHPCVPDHGLSHEGTRFAMLRHMVNNPVMLTVMIALMLALMAAAMMMIR
ncbi:MAG: hypothetical protein WD871_01085 [Xanthobacteraceae bacterium]